MNDPASPPFDFGDYITAAAASSGHVAHGPDGAEFDIFAEFDKQASSSTSTAPMNFEAAEGLLSSFSSNQGHNQHMNHTQNTQIQQQQSMQHDQNQAQQSHPSMVTAEVLELKNRLEQQLKLQRLQQLILQQQVR